MKTSRYLPVAILSSTLVVTAWAKEAAEPEAGDPAPPLTVHEWGTFTAVVGHDAQTTPWSPAVDDILPPFVHGHSRPVFGGKRQAALQRMETPVIYFYADEATTATVTAGHPAPLSTFVMTEWYPRTSNPNLTPTILPAVDENADPEAQAEAIAALVAQPLVPPGSLTWKDLEILAPGTEVDLPHDGTDNHYYPARAVASNPVAVTHSDTEDGEEVSEVEKYLFYRGNTHSGSPYTANVWGGSGFNFHGPEYAPVDRPSWGLQVKDGQARIVDLAAVQADTEPTIEFEFENDWKPVDEVAATLGAQLEKSLVAAGLYEDEAAAMVDTWDDTWFHDEGIRVLYLMPEDWVNQVLPLTIEPAPAELVRVMVGRLEIITPDVAWHITRAVSLYADEDPEIKAKGIQIFEDLKLGRFARMAANSSLKSVPYAYMTGIRLVNELFPPIPPAGLEANEEPETSEDTVAAQ